MANQLPSCVIMTTGLKGGVGKSTIGCAVAVEFARRGYATGLLDVDFAGPSVPVLLDVEARPGVAEGKMKPAVAHGVAIMSAGLFLPSDEVLTWSGPVLRGALHQMLLETDWRDIDVLLIDTPAGAGEVHIELLKLVSIDAALIVTIGDAVVQSVANRMERFLNSSGIGRHVMVRNMANRDADQGPFPSRGIIVPRVGRSRTAEQVADLAFGGAICRVVDELVGSTPKIDGRTS